MQRATIDSGSIVSVGYEAATATLELELSPGEVVQFYNVPLSVYVAFTKASSRDDYYHHNIKAIYESKQITEDIIERSNDATGAINN